MTDETVDVTDEQEITEEPTPETAPAKKQKVTFSTDQQAEVQRIVAKEKASWKRTADADKSHWTETEQSLKESIRERDELLQSTVDLLMQDLNLDEDLQELFDGMDVLAKYKWLTKRASKMEKVTTPVLPKSKETHTAFTSNRRVTI